MDIHEDAVSCLGRREDTVEGQVNRLNRPARPRAGDDERCGGSLCRSKERGRRLYTPRHHDQGQTQVEQGIGALCLFAGIEGFEIGDLGLPEDLHAGRDDTMHVPSQREPRLLHPRVVDDSLETTSTCNEAHQRLEPGFREEPSNRDPVLHPHAGLSDTRRGRLGHESIIRERRRPVCPSRLEQKAIRVGIVGSVEQCGPLGFLAKDAGDAGECRQVLLRHRARPHDPDDDADREPVDGIEVDSARTDRDGRSELGEFLASTMRNGDAAADAGAREALPLEEHLVDRLRIDPRLGKRQQKCELEQRRLFVCNLDSDTNAIWMQKLPEHDGQAIPHPSARRNGYHSSGRRRDSPPCRRRSFSVALVSRTCRSILSTTWSIVAYMSSDWPCPAY